MAYKQLSLSASTTHELLEREVLIQEEGYVFVYISNEHPTRVDAYFDDVEMTHTKTNIIQYNEYYPFGLQASTSWTRDNNDNNFLYNQGSELNTTTEWYETYFRGYDATLGRFLQVDPLATSFSGVSVYNYAFNNPVLLSDPSGAAPSYGEQAQYEWAIFDRYGFDAWTNQLVFGSPYGISTTREALRFRGLDGEGGGGEGYLNTGGGSSDYSEFWAIFLANFANVKPGKYLNNGKGSFIAYDFETKFGSTGDSSPEGIALWGEVILHEITYEQQQQTQGSGPGSSLDFMDYLGYGSSGLDLLVSGAQFTVGAIKNSGQHKAAYETAKFLKNNFNVKIRPGDLRRGTKQVLGNASKKIAVVGGVLAVGDVLIDGNIRASHLLNMGMVGVTAIPVAGWIIGGAYFVGDLATMGITGKSIGDHLDSAVGGPLVDNIYDWD